MKKHKNNRRGVTMVEILVAMLILEIFMVCVTATVPPILGMMSRVTDSSDLALIINDTSDRLTSEFALSEGFTSSAGSFMIEKRSGKRVMVSIGRATSNNRDIGVLLVDGEPVHDPEYYKGFSLVSLSVAEDAGGFYYIEIEFEGLQVSDSSSFIVKK